MPRRLALAQVRRHPRQRLRLLLRGLGMRLQRGLHLLLPSLHHFQVGQDQFQVYDLDIPHRVERLLHMGHPRIGEAAHDVQDRLHLADLRQELVPQSLPGARPAHQPRNVHELDRRRHRPLLVEHLRHPRQPRIGHRHHRAIRLDGRKGIVRNLGASGRERIEDRGLADVGEAHQAHAEHYAPTIAFSVRAFSRA